VPRIDQATVRNQLLTALPPADFVGLAPALEQVELAFKQVLQAPDQPIRHVRFLESGMVSMLAALEEGQAVEVGLVGREGLVGLPALLGAARASAKALIQGSGIAWQIEAAPLLRYTQAFHLQVAQTAACNGRHRVEQRLARWLLLAHDRAEAEGFAMTQEFMALMLGVRRAPCSGPAPSATSAAASPSSTGESWSAAATAPCSRSSSASSV
jgi:CRP-like cAMP-binding protein